MTMPPNRYDLIIERLLVVLLAFMPFAMGARIAWSEEVAIFISGLMVLCFCIKILAGYRANLVPSWAYMPLILLLLITCFQLAPLPLSIVKHISPNTFSLKSEILSVAGVSENFSRMSLSFYPLATARAFRLMFAVVSVFVVVVNVFRRDDQIKRLLLSISVIGAAVAVLSLLQILLGNGKIYWFIPVSDKALSGPFVNHGHYAQFINLSLGAALGWIFTRLAQDLGSNRSAINSNDNTANTGGNNPCPNKATPPEILDYLFSGRALALRWVFLMVILCAVTVFLSLSRGGMFSMLVAGCLTLAAFGLYSQTRVNRHGWLIAAVAFAVFVCILVIGFDAVYDRFARLDIYNSYRNRWQIFKDLTAAYRMFPLLGTGLGTHAVIYPMFQSIKTTLLFTHAENEYAQLAEETGLVGLAAMLAFGIYTVVIYFKNIRSIRSIDTHNSPIRYVSYGLGFGLIAVLVHSLSDFGQHVPANAFLSAIFCALLISLAKRPQEYFATEVKVPSGANVRIAAVLCTVLFAGAWLWSLNNVNHQRIAAAYWQKVLDVEKGLVGKNWLGSSSEYADLLANAEAAVKYQPEDIHYNYCLNAFRWYSISKTPPVLGSGSNRRDYLSTAWAIAGNLGRTAMFCPTYGPAHSVAGQIEKFVLSRPEGAAKIRLGFRLAPCDSITCLVAGKLDVLEGKYDDCVEKFSKAVELNPSLFNDVANIYIEDLSRPAMAIQAAGDNIDNLTYVASVLNQMQYCDLASETYEKIRCLLKQKCLTSCATAADFAYLAQLYAGGNNVTAAIESYQRAVSLDYSKVDWHLGLARLLAADGRIEDAIHEARVCLRLRPRFPAAQELLGKLSTGTEFVEAKNINYF